MTEEILNRRWYERATALLADQQDPSLLHDSMSPEAAQRYLIFEAVELIEIALEHYAKFCNGYD